MSVARVHANVDIGRDAPKVTDGCGEFPKHLFGGKSSLLLVGFVSCLLKGITQLRKWTPYHSGIRMPVCFSKTCRPGGRPICWATRLISAMMCSRVGINAAWEAD